MKLRIADIMLLVIIVAVDIAAVRRLWLSLLSAPQDEMEQLLIVGTVPMVNALAVALLLGLRRPRSRPFVLGFAASGASVLASFVTLTACFRDEVMIPYLVVFYRLSGVVRYWPEVVPVAVVAVVVLLVPQLAFALIGGFIVKAARRRGRPPTTPT